MGGNQHLKASAWGSIAPDKIAVPPEGSDSDTDMCWRRLIEKEAEIEVCSVSSELVTRRGVRRMAWGIIMTVWMLVGMLGLVVFKVTTIGWQDSSSTDPEAAAPTAVAQRHAA